MSQEFKQKINFLAMKISCRRKLHTAAQLSFMRNEKCFVFDDFLSHDRSCTRIILRTELFLSHGYNHYTLQLEQDY